MQAGAEKVGVHRMGQIHRGKPKPLRPLKIVDKVVTDPSRDALLTDFGKTTLVDRYLLPGESFQDMFARVATAYADDIGHAQRIYDYISKLWFMPATPVLSNGGAERGLPISCFLNAVGDSLDGIMDTWNENVGSPPTAGASAPIGAAFVPSAKKLVRTARRQGSFRSSA